MEIIIDTREKLPWVFEGYPVTIAKLDTGDYSIKGYEDQFCIERKSSTSELAGNITSSRFKKELSRLSVLKSAFLLLEFSVDDVMNFPIGSNIPYKKWKSLKITGNFILSCLLKYQIDYNIHVIFGGDRDVSNIIAEKLLRYIYDDRH